MTDSYTPVPGSAALKTRSLAESADIVALEEAAPATPVASALFGEHLARTVVRDRFVPVLVDVYDRLALVQEAEEQAVYGHLYRLALADERNFCRVKKRDLMARARLSERRLLKALAGLVEKGHVALLHRDRRGTLFRVRLPHEVFGEAAGDAVLVAREGRAAASPRPPPAPVGAARASARPGPSAPARPKAARGARAEGLL